MNPLGRIEAPVDYRELWQRLEERLVELMVDQAGRAATTDDLNKVLRYQGAYGFVAVVQSVMSELVDKARHPPAEEPPANQIQHPRLTRLRNP